MTVRERLARLMTSQLSLAINGYRLKADRVDSTEIMLAAGELDERGLSVWIKSNMARLPHESKPGRTVPPTRSEERS